MVYPRKEEILANLITPNKEQIDIIDRWKEKWYNGLWSKRLLEEKIKALKDLAEGLVSQDIDLSITLGLSWYTTIFEDEKRAIIGVDITSPSIISMLHEIGHVMHGTSELKACAYSIGIFSTCFPGAYKNLTWKGHMLVKQ